MGDHARLPPSAAGRWMVCPGSVLLIENLIGTGMIPADDTNEAAQWGTDAHAYLERGLRTSIPPEYLVADANNPDEVDKAQVAQVAYEYANQQKAARRPCALNPEMKVRISKPTEPFGTGWCWGSSDVVLASSIMLEAVDLKAGKWPVPPTATQLKLYLLGALNEYWRDPRMPCPFGQFRATVVQPRSAEPFPVKSADFSLDELRQLADAVTAIEQEIEQELQGGTPRYVPGEEQCKFCPAQQHCEAYASWARTAIFQPVMTPGQNLKISELPEIVAGGALKNLPAAQLGRMKELIPAVKTFLEAIDAQVSERLNAGQDVPGWKMVEGERPPKWLKEAADLKKEFRVLGLKPSQYERKSLCTPLQVMKAPKITEEQSAAVQRLWERPKVFKVVADDHPAADAAAWMKTVPG